LSSVANRNTGHSGQTARFALVVTTAFALIGAAAISRHELWGDELQAWLIARHSGSLSDLFVNMRYEGHPPLWYLLLYGVTRVTANPAGMQTLHLAIASAAVFVLARFAPFSRLQKCVFVLGYFPLYEYGVISRSYGLGLLVLFGFCAAFRAGPEKNYPLLAVLLAVLVQTNVYQVMIAAALVLGIFVEMGGFRGIPIFLKSDVGRRIAGLALLAASVVSVAVVMVPPEDRGAAFDWREHDRWEGLTIALGSIWNGYVPLPPPSVQFWNRNVLSTGWATAALGSALAAGSVLLLARRRAALVAYVGGAAAMVAFTALVYYGSVRHYGHTFVLFVACLWIAERLPEEPANPRSLDGLAEKLWKFRGRVLTALLVVHVAAAAIAVSVDWRHPFTQSERVAAFLRERGLTDLIVAGDIDNGIVPIGAALDREIYFLQGDRMGSFVLWDRGRFATDPKTFPDLARAKAAERGEPVVVVLNYPSDHPAFEKLAEFTGAIEPYENYWVYVVPNP
jgi:hypothetical protein